MRRLLMLLIVLAGPALAQDGFDGWDSAPAPVADPWAGIDAATGERLFRSLCAGCHGGEGDGKGIAADSMRPRPRDLTRGEFRFRSTASGTLPTRDDLLRTISLGLPGTEMPGWSGQVPDRALRSLVLYVESLSTRFLTQGRKPGDVLVVRDALKPPESTPETLARGRSVYEAMKCADCHGPSGRGDGKAAARIAADRTIDSRVFDFTHGVYKGGSDVRDLYRTFVTGLDGTPMPSYVDSLPDEADRWALALYVLSLTRPRGPGFYLTERPRWYEPSAGADHAP